MRMLGMLGGLLLLQATTTLGQQSYEDTSSPETPTSFHYQGCAEVELSSFGDAIIFQDGTLTHAACQAACQGHSIAAFFPDSCRCGDDYDAFTPLESSACDYPCMGDPAYGMCGSECPTKGPGISTIYITSEVVTTEFEDDPPEPGFSLSIVVQPSPSGDPTLIPEVISEPPSLPTGPPADPPAVLSESTESSDTTARSTSLSSTSDTSAEITLFPSANATVSSTTSSTSTGTTESTTPNVERDDGDPPAPSQLLQSDVNDVQGQPLPFLSALALVVAAAV